MKKTIKERYKTVVDLLRADMWQCPKCKKWNHWQRTKCRNCGYTKVAQ